MVNLQVGELVHKGGCKRYVTVLFPRLVSAPVSASAVLNKNNYFI